MTALSTAHRCTARLALALLLVACFVACCPLCSSAQRSKDPLTADQEEQVRAVADQPNERVKLYIKFIEERTTTIDNTVKRPPNQHPGLRIHDALQEFTRLVDELQDNLDEYEETHQDIRKSLPYLLEHSAKWPAVLDLPPESPEYDFVRKSALEATATLHGAAQELLKSQLEYFAKHPPPKN